MYMVGANLGPNYFHVLPFAKLPQNSPNNLPFLIVENFPSELWRKHNLILTVPCGMSCRFISIIHFNSLDFIVMQLADRVSEGTVKK